MDHTTLLYEVSRALSRQAELKQTLYDVLDLLASNMNMIRGIITIFNPLREEISIEVAHGIPKSAIRKGVYKLGEGITGQVIQEGRPVSIARISESERFLNRTGTRKNKDDSDVSFFCVPIKNQQQVIGALSVDRPYESAYPLAEGEKLLSVVAAMIAAKVIHLERMQREKERLEAENERLRLELEKKYHIRNIVGNSNKMREVYQMISQVAGSNATVLIRGESGTGKELVANAIHYNSRRSNHPFIKVNCAALPANLIESELFGHEKGAFTGAIHKKPGKFELADKGTLFLDEIGSVTPEVQAKLLRVLQEKEFERVGGTRSLRADVRIIAATNKNLEEAVTAEEFRSDLYYRINVFPIYMPPLRERKTDILVLADHFLEKYARENAKAIQRFSTSAIDMLMAYHWPGNVRELENCIERAVLLCEDKAIHGYHLPPTLQTAGESESKLSQTLEGAVEKLEKEMIIDALKQTRGNISAASKMLGSTIRKISYKAEKYGINPRRYH